MALAMIGITIPTFVTAPILTLIFGVYGVHLFGHDISLPVGGWNGGALAQHDPAGDGAGAAADRHHRAADARQHDRGAALQLYPHRPRQGPARRTRIVLRHALRAALLPLVSYLGPAMAGILTGSLIVEQIFGLPGIGRYFVQGALNRDYTLVMGVVICYAALIILLNFLADMLYAPARSAREADMIAIGSTGGRRSRSTWSAASRAAACGSMRAAGCSATAPRWPAWSCWRSSRCWRCSRRCCRAMPMTRSTTTSSPARRTGGRPTAACNAGGTHWFGTDAVGPRPVRARAVRRAGVAGGGPGRHPGLAADRRRSMAPPPAISAGGSTS